MVRRMADATPALTAAFRRASSSRERGPGTWGQGGGPVRYLAREPAWPQPVHAVKHLSGTKIMPCEH
jgi:hypothetical protein